MRKPTNTMFPAQTFCEIFGGRLLMSTRRTVSLILIAAVLFGCAGIPTSSTQSSSSTPVTVSDIEQAESYVKSIRWILPLASGVIAMFFPQYVSEAQMAIASYNALVATADAVIANYKGDPGAVDAAKLAEILGQLKTAWLNLDGSYQADPASVQALVGAK